VAIKQARKEWGVDDELPVPWMMVPKDGANVALLSGEEGVTLAPEHKNLVDVVATSDPKDPRLADLNLGAAGFAASGSTRAVIVTAKKGAGVGDTTIIAKDASAQRGKASRTLLEVSVKAPRSVSVVFHFVRHQDGSGKPLNHTSKDPTIATEWVKGMNAIYTPQSNVVFKIQDARWVQYETQFSRVIRPQDYAELFKKRVEGAGLMNVFIVGEYEKDSNRRSTADISSGATVNGKDIICEEASGKDKHDMSILVAHEALHFLLREDHHKYVKEKSHWLMEQLAFQTGQKIPKHQANKLNPTRAVTKGKK
jgi:hypothetical protein